MKKTISFTISCCILFAAFLTFISCPGGDSGPTIISMELVYQNKDSVMVCDLCEFDPGLSSDPATHPWNHAAGTNGTYGDGDDCPHCSTYCAPAAIAMISKSYGREDEKILQDWIYDGGKNLPDAIRDGILTTHGVGMFHGVGSLYYEVQDAMDFALEPMLHDEYNSGKPMTATILVNCIQNSRPVLWLDHNGWPDNLSDDIDLPTTITQYQGHAKVIAGYDDRETSDTSDDRCLVYDPWPEYNDDEVLPAGASKGPDDTFDPYWLPVSSIIGDANDVFLVPTDSIP